MNGVTGEKKLDVHLNKEVTNIKVDSDCKGVTVTTKDGSSYYAESVVVTVSLGVLKAETIKFDPPLSERKQKAIKNAGW